jgi:DNA-binding NarL/FixJ family response regulator
MRKRLLIVDDHEIIRMGVRILLAGRPTWEVCGEAADGEQALREVVRLAPDVVLLDLSIPLMNGFEVTRELRRIAPATKIVLFSIHEVPSTAQHIGADAFVSKAAGVEALATALDRVVQARQATE